MSAMSLFSRFGLVGLFTALTLSACTCEGPDDNPDTGAVASVSALPVDGGFELRLSGLEPGRRVRSLQVDIKLEGAQATQAVALGSNDILEAGLGVPKNDFTVVVADTRRLNLPLGSVVRVTTEGTPSSIALSRALAIDDTGAERSVTVVVP